MNYYHKKATPIVEERISCDNCGDKTSAWDWTPGYDRFCLECLARQNDEWDYNPAADRGCHEYHQSR
jgi:hypothetical protein